MTENFVLLTDDKRPDGQTSGNRDRGNDTPDTVVSSSSPECVIHELPIRFPGMAHCRPMYLIAVCGVLFMYKLDFAFDAHSHKISDIKFIVLKT